MCSLYSLSYTWCASCVCVVCIGVCVCVVCIECVSVCVYVWCVCVCDVPRCAAGSLPVLFRRFGHVLVWHTRSRDATDTISRLRAATHTSPSELPIWVTTFGRLFWEFRNHQYALVGQVWVATLGLRIPHVMNQTSSQNFRAVVINLSDAMV